MTTKVLSFYNLREGAKLEEFMDWSRKVDQPTSLSAKACHALEVFAIRGEAANKPFFQIVEVLELESWEAWQATLKSEAFAGLVAEWSRFGDASSVVTVFCEKV